MLIKLTGEQNEELEDRYKEAVNECLRYEKLAKDNPHLRPLYDRYAIEEFGKAAAYYLLGDFELEPRIEEF